MEAMDQSVPPAILEPVMMDTVGEESMDQSVPPPTVLETVMEDTVGERRAEAEAEAEEEDVCGISFAEDGLSSVGGGRSIQQGVGTTAVDKLHGCSTIDSVAPHFAFTDDIEIESAQLDSQPDRIIPSNGMSAEPYEFLFSATDDYFVDLNSVTMHAQVQVTKADGTALPAATDDCWPVDNLLSSLWKTVEVKFNHVTMHPETSSQHGYRAQMEYLLSIENSTKNSYVTAWFGQTEAQRKARFKGRQAGVIDLCGPIAIDCLRTNTHLAPNNCLSLTFHRNTDKFLLLRGSDSTENYKLKILDVHLRCNRIRLVPAVKQRVLSGLKGSGQNYRLSHTVVNDYPVKEGSKAVSIRLHQGGPLPNQVVVGMVLTSAFTGEYGSDPYKFEHFNMDMGYLRVNGMRMPQDPLTPDFANGHYARELLHLYQNTGKFRVNGGNSITEADFIARSFLLPFDLTPDQCNNAHAHASRTGTMELELSFSEALAKGITVVVLSVSNQVMQLDGLKSPPLTAVY